MVGRHRRQFWPVHLLRRMGLDAIRPDNFECVRHGGLYHGFRLRRARQLARGSGNNGPTIISNVGQILTAPITSTATSMVVTSSISNASKMVPVAQFNINSVGGVNCEFASGTCPETPLLWIDDELVEYCSLNNTTLTIQLGVYNGAADDGTGATSCVGGTGRAAGSGRGMFGTLPAAHNPYVVSDAQIPNIFGACPAPQSGALANGGTMVRRYRGKA